MNMAAKGLTHFLLFWLFVAGVVGLFYRQEISEWVIDVAGDSEIAAYLNDDDTDDGATEKAEAPAADEAEAQAQAEPAPEAKPDAPAPAVSDSAVAPQEPTPEPAAEAEAKPAAEQAAEQAAEPAAESVAEPTTESAAEAEAQPVTEPAAEPAAATPAEPETAGVAEETAPAPAEETASAPAEQPAEPSESAAAPAPTPATPTPVAPMPTAPAPMQAVPAPMPGAPVPPQAAAPGYALSPELVRDWSQARDLYWRGDLAKAEEAYMSLVREHADEPDLAGELANLLLQIGKHEDAAGFYLEAGLRMLRGPMPGRAGMVVGILNRLSPEKGDLLRKKMMEKMNPQAGQEN